MWLRDVVVLVTARQSQQAISPYQTPAERWRSTSLRVEAAGNRQERLVVSGSIVDWLASSPWVVKKYAESGLAQAKHCCMRDVMATALVSQMASNARRLVPIW